MSKATHIFGGERRTDTKAPPSPRAVETGRYGTSQHEKDDAKYSLIPFACEGSRHSVAQVLSTSRPCLQSGKAPTVVGIVYILTVGTIVCRLSSRRDTLMNESANVDVVEDFVTQQRINQTQLRIGGK